MCPAKAVYRPARTSAKRAAKVFPAHAVNVVAVHAGQGPRAVPIWPRQTRPVGWTAGPRASMGPGGRAGRTVLTQPVCSPAVRARAPVQRRNARRLWVGLADPFALKPLPTAPHAVDSP